MKWKLAAGLALVAGALIFVLAKGFGRDPHEVPFMLAGKPAPAFTLKRLDNGQVLTLAQLKGRPVVLNFWSTWCGPCKMEHPVLEWGAQALASQAQFFGVVFEDTSENARAWLREGNANPALVQLEDERSQVAVDFGVAGVPETYFIDASGIIRNKFVGPIDQQTLISRVAALAQPLAHAEASP